MSTQQALLDFLTYSYFKIVPKESYRDGAKTEYSDYCIKKVIMKAYEDATNEGAYNTLFKKTIASERLNGLKAASRKARKASADFLFRQIRALSTYAGNYDAWHENTCQGLCDRYRQVYLEKAAPFFTYGNAQKWVNMSMKYIWLLGLLPAELPETALHVPVDSYIIDALWEEENHAVCFPVRVDKPVSRCKKYKNPSDYVTGWSQWTQKQYCRIFRESLDSEKFTLEWENGAWIRAAEKRKKADLDKQYDLFWDK